MGRKSPKFRTEEKDYKIYVLMFPPSNDFYIGNSGQKDLYTTLKNHCQLRIDRTKARIKTYIEEEKKAPQMYLLNTTKEVKTDNFKRLLAYAKVMEDNGYHCINNGLFREDMEDMLPATKAIYDEIKYCDVAELLKKEKQLYPKYKPGRKQSKDKSRMTITLSLTPQEYEIIEKRAKEAELPLRTYVYEQCIYGVTINMSYSVFNKYLSEIRGLITLIQTTIIVMCQLEQCFPYDIERVENARQAVTEHYGAFLKLNIKDHNRMNKFFAKMQKFNRCITLKNNEDDALNEIINNEVEIEE